SDSSYAHVLLSCLTRSRAARAHRCPVPLHDALPISMGLFGITEGAIPFAAQDPIRVIPSIVVGSMVGSVIAMLGHVGDRVAHGGPIVAVLGAVDNVLMFFIAVIIGSFVTAFL